MHILSLFFSFFLLFNISSLDNLVNFVTMFLSIAVGIAATGPLTIIRRRTVCQRTGLSGTTIWRLVRAGKFPAPIQLASKQSIGWIEQQVEAWIESRARATDKGRPSPNPRAHRDKHPE
jgi:prophage regulatory protein